MIILNIRSEVSEIFGNPIPFLGDTKGHFTINSNISSIPIINTEKTHIKCKGIWTRVCICCHRASFIFKGKYHELNSIGRFCW